MGALDIFTPQGKFAGERPAFVPKDFGDTAGAAFTNTRQNYTTDAEIRLVGDPLNSRNTLLKERIGKDVFELTGMDKKYPNPTPEGRAQMLEEANGGIDDFIARGRKENPQMFDGIKTSAEIRDEGRAVAQKATADFEDVSMRNTSSLSRVSGSLVGGIGGAFTDPVNILTLPVGAGPTKAIGQGAMGVAKGILMQAGKEGVIQAGIETASIPQIARWQKDVGHVYGMNEALTDISFAYLGGAGIRAASSGIVPGVRAVRRGTEKASSYILDKVANSAPGLAQTAKDAMRYMSRSAYIDEDSPAPVKTRQNLQEHRKNFEKAGENVERYERPAVDIKAVDDAVDNSVAAAVAAKESKLDINDPFVAQAMDIVGALQAVKSFDVNNPREVGKILGYTPVSLTQFIKNSGGIADTGGDLASAGINYKRLPGLIRKTKDDAGGGMFGGGGSTAASRASQMDYAKERAYDAGYFPGKSSADDISDDEFKAAIRQDLEGEKIYTIDDVERISVSRDGSDLADMYDRIGITADMDAKAVAQQLRDLAEANEIPFDKNAYALAEYRAPAMEPPFEVTPTDRATAARAEFDAVLKDDPDMPVHLEDGSTITLKEYANVLKESANIIEAITSCRLA